MNKYLDIKGLERFYRGLKGKFVNVEVKTTEQWNSQIDYIPAKGQLIVYSDYATVDDVDIPNFKIADGLAYAVDLPFVNQDMRDLLVSHMRDDSIHVTSREKEFWNNKVTVLEGISQDEILALTKE